ncbi:carbonic anhydrase 9-like isoform X2 [Ascaphus truei]|uniref:carbonic anhydrase 9-like isoform X2 n=1 Tax=Ascaphus truei TaxID=8439 RepID=UPI003F5A8A1C
MMIVGGLSQDYRAAQLHFHWGSSSSPGSEHTVNAQRFPGEIHVVHYSMEYESINDAKNQPGGLAVLAAFIQEGPELNPTYEQLLSHLREVEEEGKSIEIPGFDIHGLLPQRLDRYYRYNGSLTTPPCYQSVNWTLFNQTVSLSQEQLAVLENTVHSEHDHILQLNFREPQRLNGRHVLTSFKSPIGGRRGPGAGAEGSGAHALSTGDMLAVIFGVLFGVTAVAFLVYVRKTRSRNQRLGSENKSVIYKAATTDENLA